MTDDLIEALRHLEALCLQLPTMYTPWFYRGQSLFHRREVDQALPCLEKAVHLNGGFVPARQLLSEVYRQLGRQAASQVELGQVHVIGGRLHQARFAFEEALSHDAGVPGAASGLELVERRLARLESPTPQDLYRVLLPRYRTV